MSTGGREEFAENRSNEQVKEEQEEIDEFNLNTDYDPRATLHESSTLEEATGPDVKFDDVTMANFIVTARVYDVLMALLKEANPDAARDLLELHRSGSLLGSVPSFNGNFLTDLMNDSDQDD